MVTNGHWASIYFAYFDGSNLFLRENSQRLDGTAHEFLTVLNTGMPRLTAICLCRLWDLPNKDRHSLPTLIKFPEFSSRASNVDASFVDDCEKFSDGELIRKLRNFRVVDLAHNLELTGDGGLTFDGLRQVLLVTQPLLDRMARILQMGQSSQDFIFRTKKQNCEHFWQMIAPKILGLQDV